MSSRRSINGRCTECGKVFTKREHLLRHVRSHTGEKPFTCKHCGRSYARSDVLRRHERGHDVPSPLDAIPTTQSCWPASSEDSSLPLNGFSRSPDASSSNFSGMDWVYNLDQYGLPLEDFDLSSLDDLLTDLTSSGLGMPRSRPLSRQSNPTPHVPRTPNFPQSSRQRSPAGEQEGLDRHQYMVDEQYSTNVSEQLKPVPHGPDTVLSVEFLNSCLQLYFEHFHPIFPVIHAPTFRPSAHNILLLTSMCSLGSLFIGSPEAAAQGQQLYSRLNKAILASWEMHLAQPRRSSLPMIQAALLGQTFGMLSRKAEDRFMTEAFQGTMLAWARSVGAFDTNPSKELLIRMDEPALSSTAWAAWARAEELNRLALALYVHDVEIACLFQRTPYLRHGEIIYSSMCPDEVFQASSAKEWERLWRGHQDQLRAMVPAKVSDWVRKKTGDSKLEALSYAVANSSFTAYAVLANSGGHIVENVRLGALCSSTAAQDLTRWYQTYYSRSGSIRSDDLCLRILWLRYTAQLYADVAMLERAVDAHASGNELAAASAWAASPNSICALLYVCVLQKRASELQLGVTPPIHLPRAIFLAGVVFTAYFRFLPRSHGADSGTRGGQIGSEVVHEWKSTMLGMPGIGTLAQSEDQQPKQMVAWACNLLTQRGRVLSYNCIDLLRKLSRWGVSEIFAERLEAFVRSGSEPMAS